MFTCNYCYHRALLESAATADARNDTNGVPMHFAAAGGHLDCILLLREYGASVFATDSYGSTVLNVAEDVSPRNSHMHRVLSILRSLSEADTRKERRENETKDKQDIGNRLDSKNSRRSKAREIRRLAEREKARASQMGDEEGDASSKGIRLLAEAVDKASLSAGG